MPFPWYKTVLKWLLLDMYFSLPKCFLLPNLWNTIIQFIRCYIKLSSLHLNLATAQITWAKKLLSFTQRHKPLWIWFKQYCCQRKSFSLTTAGFEPMRTALLGLDRKTYTYIKKKINTNNSEKVSNLNGKSVFCCAPFFTKIHFLKVNHITVYQQKKLQQLRKGR